jgi:tetratricopeptide (TPR) repeat protein
MKHRDVDSAEIAFRTRTAAYAIIVGVVIAGLGVAVAGLLGLVIGIASGVFVYFGTLYLAERSGRVAASLYHSSGSSTPAKREYSFADSLVARGMYAEAARQYAQHASEHPDDAEPRIRRARVLRDHLGDYEEAFTEYKQILRMPALPPETQLAVLREQAELCTHRIRDPRRALPYLARIGEKFGGTPTAAWARQELADIKAAMREGR